MADLRFTGSFAEEHFQILYGVGKYEYFFRTVTEIRKSIFIRKL